MLARRPVDRASRAALRRALGALLVAAALASCGRGDDAASPADAASQTSPAEASVAAPDVTFAPAPSRRVVPIREVEFLTQEIVDRLDALARKLAVRDFGGALEAFADDFAGDDPFSAPRAALERLPLGAERSMHDAAGAPTVDRAGLIASWQQRVGPWRRVEHVRFVVRDAQFQQGAPPPYGRVEAAFEMLGETEGGGRAALRAELALAVRRHDGQWRIAGLDLRSIEQRARATPLFTDVSRSARVAHEGLRYGEPGNDTDAWQGLAVADVDGDGWLDVFLPSSRANFLYVQAEDGTFRDEAEARGVAAPAGGTGAVFFDADADGWIDLMVGHRGREGADGVIEGSPVRFYRNLGEGRFEDATDRMGARVVTAASSLVAFDAHGDGWVDVFVAGYGYMDRARNDSWVDATNGAPDALLANDGGATFTDITEAAGLTDRRWSYAAAAADYDEDGLQDLYVGNNFGSNRLYHNEGVRDGVPRFVDVARELGVEERGNTMAAVFGDVDGDARLDLCVVGPESVAGQRVLGRLRGEGSATRGVPEAIDELFELADGNALFLARGDGFVPAPFSADVREAGWAFGSVLADLDTDGALDLFCVNGFVTGDLPEDT